MSVNDFTQTLAKNLDRLIDRTFRRIPDFTILRCTICRSHIVSKLDCEEYKKSGCCVRCAAKELKSIKVAIDLVDTRLCVTCEKTHSSDDYCPSCFSVVELCSIKLVDIMKSMSTITEEHRAKLFNAKRIGRRLSRSSDRKRRIMIEERKKKVVAFHR